MGFLDFLFGGGGGAGLLNKKHSGQAPFGFGQMFGQQQQPGGMPFGFGGQQQPPMTFGQRFSNNDDMLLALGAGLLGHRQNATAMPLGDVFMGAMQGRRLDRKENRENERENKTRGWLQRTFGLSDEDADAAVGNPEAMSWYLKRASGGDPTDDMQEYNFAKQQGYEGSLHDWLTSQRSDTNINMAAGEKSWDVETNKLFAGDYVDLQKGARQSNTMIGRLDRMEQLLADPNVFTGAGGETIADLRKIGSTFGVETEGLGATDAVRAISNEMALQMRNPAGGAGMPGAMSDKDLNFLKAIVPGLNSTPEGNLLLIDYMRRIQHRNVEIASLANEYVQSTGRLDAGFYDYLSQWSEQNPLFPEASENGARSLGMDAQNPYQRYGLEPP